MFSLMDNIRRLPIFLKWIEIVVAIISIVLMQEFGDYPGLGVSRTALIYSVTGGYLLILPMILVGFNFQQEIGRLMIFVWMVGASFLWFAAGALIFETYTLHMDHPALSFGYLIGSGILILLNGCIFALDSVFTYRDY